VTVSVNFAEVASCSQATSEVLGRTTQAEQKDIFLDCFNRPPTPLASPLQRFGVAALMAGIGADASWVIEHALKARNRLTVQT